MEDRSKKAKEMIEYLYKQDSRYKELYSRAHDYIISTGYVSETFMESLTKEYEKVKNEK